MTGLIGSRSRKQSDWYKARTGPPVVREKHDTARFYYLVGNLSVSTELTVGTIAAGQKGRILRISVYVRGAAANTNYYLLNIDGSYWQFIRNQDNFNYEQNWDYENAPNLNKYVSIYVDQSATPVAHEVYVSVLYTTEPAEDGYLTF